MSVNVLIATLLLLSDSLLILTGPADKRAINTKTIQAPILPRPPLLFGSLYACLQSHFFVVVEYVRIDFMLKGSLMIPHKLFVFYVWIHGSNKLLFC